MISLAYRPHQRCAMNALRYCVVEFLEYLSQSIRRQFFVTRPLRFQHASV